MLGENGVGRVGRKELKPPAALVVLGRIAKVQSEDRHDYKPINAAKF